MRRCSQEFVKRKPKVETLTFAAQYSEFQNMNFSFISLVPRGRRESWQVCVKSINLSCILMRNASCSIMRSNGYWPTTMQCFTKKKLWGNYLVPTMYSASASGFTFYMWFSCMQYRQNTEMVESTCLLVMLLCILFLKRGIKLNYFETKSFISHLPSSCV